MPFRVFKKICTLIVLAGFLTANSSAYAYWIWSPENGKFVSSDTNKVSDHERDLYEHALIFQKGKQKDRAIEEFENLLRHYPHSTVAPEAQYQIGATYEEKGEYRLAFNAYKKLLENYPQSERVAEVVERLFKMGNLFLAGRKERVVGISMAAGAPKAIEIFEYIIKAAPFSAYGDQAQFHLGLAYKKTGEYPKALQAFQKVIDDYPNSNLLDDVRYQLAETSFEFSRTGTRDERAIDDAIENISDFLKRYPESSVTEKIGKLKQEIAKRDAEKNYRIALYYEKEHEFESAALYFEDVFKRYPDTEYGKLAQEKFNSLQAPIAKLHREEREMEMDLNSNAAKLKSLQEQRKTLGALTGGETDREKSLEKEIASLKEKQKVLTQDQVQDMKNRAQALVRDEKAWKEKWNAYQQKRKELRRNQAPELAVAFQRWEKSLLEEKQKLAHERETVGELKQAIKKPKAVAEEEPVAPSVVSESKLSVGGNYGLKDLVKVRNQRDALSQKRSAEEKELLQLINRFSESERQGFEITKKQKSFRELAHFDKEEENLNQERVKLDHEIQDFETKKADYVKKYGAKDIENLVIEKPTQDLKSAKENKGVSSGNSLSELKQNKAKLSGSWIAQKKVVDSISELFNVTAKVVAPSDNETPAPNVEDPEVTKLKNEFESLDARALRKRTKFIEREVRNRLEEIEDWNKQKDDAIQKLDDLMHAKSRASITSKILRPVTSPVRFMWWLTRSLAFGLSNEDRKVMKQAERAKNKMSGEDADEVRKLEEEIQLESLLIQGRYEEVKVMQKEAEALRQTAEKKGLHILPILIEKDFSVGEESLRSAERILSTEDRKEVLIEKLDHETKKLKSIEEQINEVDQAMTQMNQSEMAQTMQKAKEEKKQAGEAKKKESSDYDDKTVAEEKEQKAARNGLETLKQALEKEEGSYQALAQKLDDQLFSFYQNNYHKKSGIALSEEEKVFWNQQAELEKKRSDLEYAISVQKASEKKLLLSERKILENHQKQVQKKLGHLKKKKGTAEYEAVASEFESVQADLKNVEEFLNKF